MEHDHAAGVDPGMAMPMAVQEPAEMRTTCEGVVEDRAFGSWKGHMLPGALFVFWGTWTAVHFFRAYLLAARSRGRHGEYTARAWYEVPSRYLRLFEPVCKVLGPCFCILMELYLDHPAYRCGARARAAVVALGAGGAPLGVPRAKQEPRPRSAHLD